MREYPNFQIYFWWCTENGLKNYKINICFYIFAKDPFVTNIFQLITWDNSWRYYMLLIFNNMFKDHWDKKYLCWAMFQISSIYRWTSSVSGDKGKQTKHLLLVSLSLGAIFFETTTWLLFCIKMCEEFLSYSHIFYPLAHR